MFLVVGPSSLFLPRCGGRGGWLGGGRGAAPPPPPPCVLSPVVYARLATDERHTGCVGIVAIGVPSGASSSMEACG